MISDERVTSTDDPRSDVVFDLVFEVAWPNSAPLPTVDERLHVGGRRCIRRGRGKGFERRIWPLVLLRQWRDLIQAALRRPYRRAGQRADVRRVLTQRAL